ncbi:hypothetical protein SDC9_146951 [bioreactor metagenome]|uniref:Uncharacterized protein n=1 Tax=bioreactor metagenome TaxID=1076179 RepID=A0A645ECQ3_9ZZZZ
MHEQFALVGLSQRVERFCGAEQLVADSARVNDRPGVLCFNDASADIIKHRSLPPSFYPELFKRRPARVCVAYRHSQRIGHIVGLRRFFEI